MHKISKHSIETRIVPKKDAKEVMMDFKKIYTAHNLSNAKSEYENFKEKYKDNKKLMKKVNDNIYWIYQIFEYPNAIRKAIYTTNAIESLNSALRKVTKEKGSFINKEALLKVLFLRVKDFQGKWANSVANWKNINLELIEIFGERYIKYIEANS